MLPCYGIFLNEIRKLNEVSKVYITSIFTGENLPSKKLACSICLALSGLQGSILWMTVTFITAALVTSIPTNSLT
jgi:hypothetical protein